MSVIAPFHPRSRSVGTAHGANGAPARWPPALAGGSALPAGTGSRKGCDWRILMPALVMLGPVLHVDSLPAGASVHLPDHAPWPARPELLGMACAVRVVASVRLDSDGPCECLHFLDAAGTSIASLWLLPDSDFLAWEILAECLPAIQMHSAAWQCRQCHAARGWARASRFESTRLVGGELLDASAPARLSAIGHARARHLATAAGARLVDGLQGALHRD